MGESLSKHSPKYQMKHRLTGAAVIIIFTLSVILLLLREPAVMPGSEVATNEVVAENQVFKSNIVPLNVSSVNLNEKGADSAENSPQPIPLVTEDIAAPREGYNAETESSNKRPEKEEKDGQKLVMTKKAEGLVSSRSQASSPPEVSDGTESGWSVRVGTFTKQENVERIFTLLGDNGFNAKRTQVQTASGEATRVWLGPYAKRETADTVNARLHTLRGEKGYVTKHAP